MNSTDENKRLTQRFYNEVMNSHKIGELKSFCTADFVDHNPSPGHSGKGLADLTAQLNEMLTAMPDMHVTTDIMLAEEDKVVTYLTITGTNSGPLWNKPATNKHVKFNGVDIVHIKDGKATERWGLFDDFSMMTQLGMMGT